MVRVPPVALVRACLLRLPAADTRRRSSIRQEENRLARVQSSRVQVRRWALPAVLLTRLSPMGCVCDDAQTALPSLCRNVRGNATTEALPSIHFA